MMNLRKRSIGETEKCPCCGREVESIVHSIIRCAVAKRVWDCWDFQFGENGLELFDVSEVALQILDKRLVRDLELFLWLLGRYGITEILLFLSQFVDCQIIFGVLPLDIFMSIGWKGWR